MFLFFKDHSSFWYSKSRTYPSFVKEDIFVRKFIFDNLGDVGVSQVEIKRKLNFLVINIHVAKPNQLMGLNGSKLYELRNNLSSILSMKFLARDITINIVEIVSPDSNARMLAEFVRQQLEKRVPFRRIIKASILKAQKAGVKGIKIQIAGRLNGAEIARTEWIREGQVPLQNLKANIDYCCYKARVIPLFFL